MSYGPPTGPLLAQAQKRKIEALENDKSSLYEMLWYLQTTSPSKAAALLQYMRAAQGQDLGAIFENFERGNRNSMPSAADCHTLLDDSPSTSRESPSSPMITVPEVMDHPRLFTVRRGRDGATGVTLVSSAQASATVASLQSPLDMFFDCVGALFYIVTRNEAASSIATIEASGNHHTPLGVFFSNGSSLKLRTLSAELSGMAAIGVVHSQLADPSTAPPAELADYFYAVAKHGLDSVILYNPLRAMKLDLKACPQDWSATTYEDIRRTHRTLVHLQCWLSASLDHNSSSLSSALLSSFDDLDAPPEDMIRQECVKVSIIKAALLHRLPTKAPIPETTTLEFRAQLSRFHARLPDWMTTAKLLHGDEGELMATFRPVIFYVHLFYLSAMMLLSRRLIIAYIPVDTVGRVGLPPEAQRAIEEGYQAAHMNASVMNLMLHEGKVVQVCWLCIYTAYTAGVMIAHKAAQKALYGGEYHEDLETLNKCIGILQYCAQKDALAGRFQTLLTGHLSALREGNQPPNGSHGSSASASPSMHKYLFSFNPGPSKLQATAQELLRIIHRPFSSLKSVVTQKTLSNRAETTMGTHLEWEYELKGSDCAEDMLTSQRASSSRMQSDDSDIQLHTGDASGSSAKRQCLQPEAEGWAKWTPPTWQQSFSLPK
ncbi:nitrate assimilation regulatory protein nira [Stemphylium lycopersici]|nr:nitrate assimilation regulatory protein nira [Stemphylium lycopersici]